jgi:phage portal protein BeeE
MNRLKSVLTRKASTGIALGGTGVPFNSGSVFSRPLFGNSLEGKFESIGSDFDSMVEDCYQSNGVVFACILARALPFSEARFQFQKVLNGRPGELFGDQSLTLLENPWPNGTTGELLFRMEQDGSLAGNFFATTYESNGRTWIRRLRPDWVTIITGVRGESGSPFAVDAEVAGYMYKPPGEQGTLLLPEDVVHYSPIPDPMAQWRGMSWLSSVLPEIRSDSAATEHKLKFFSNGTLSNMVVTYDATVTKEDFEESVELFKLHHTGKNNAYKAIHLGGGADAKMLGMDLKALDFKAVQGAGETRIAAASGVGAIIARLSEGMQGSSLNAGNYGAAKRQFADMTLRPLWRTASASLSKFAPAPGAARLWTDTRDVAFLKEDLKDAAEILSKDAATISALVTAGYDPDAAVTAVNAGDLSLLKGKHSGMYSVQLQPAGAATSTPPVGGTQ